MEVVLDEWAIGDGERNAMERVYLEAQVLGR